MLNSRIHVAPRQKVLQKYSSSTYRGLRLKAFLVWFGLPEILRSLVCLWIYSRPEKSDSVNLTQSIPLLCEFKYCDEFEFNFHWSENLVKMKRDNFWGKKDICVKLRYSKNSAWIFNLFSLPGPGLMDMNNGFRDFTAFLYPDLRTRSNFVSSKLQKNEGTIWESNFAKFYYFPWILVLEKSPWLVKVAWAQN